ncbi:putative radical SAM enzyme, TIGR03279 family [Clostridium sp. USBA 49]|jgi:putative radical SAM enzyme (TIGR03279 family)|uniref:DUF512 domain-containing protein n=1 Tax=Clostridium sp. USBA 49 TaxID=1881060 RepID=UPI00099A2409|nr:DUF512 domain-containing protein [Clostridium sp. USBA 49]SKA76126.1 putative radical SAM enzyme, TIGR03279 family [Clostridium sp. USBA 49]
MKNKIVKVEKGSIAEELGIEVGDKLISINDIEIKDVIDYKFLTTDEFIVVRIEKENGDIWDLEIEKEYDEKLGIEFENSILDEATRCSNNCIFCFIDQLPKGMRKTLYFKDDDSRLSFLQGNFITLTNMNDEDINRIIKYKISPINVSVHTTNPELRVKMLNNRFAGDIYKKLEKLAKGGIEINCQIVLCPGLNNGNELKNTIEDLFKLYPSIKNVAAVPVGITKFRKGLFDITLYNKESSKEEIINMSKLQKKYIEKIGYPFIRLSDEFYVMAGMEVPNEEFYGEYEQLEDGIGMIRIFKSNIKRSLKKLKKNVKGDFTIVTGVSAFDTIKEAADQIMKLNNKIKLNVIKITNKFFGETITVAGLLTGQDIIEKLKECNLGQYIIISKNMLKSDEKIFLDDIKVEDIEKIFGKKILIAEYTGEDLIDILNNFSKEE